MKTRTKRKPTSANQTRTKGLRCFERQDRPKAPFYVSWSERDAAGKRVQRAESFADADDRDRRAKEIADQKRDGALLTLSRPEIEEYRAIKRSCEGVPWQDVLGGYRAWRQMQGLAPVAAMTVAEWAEKYLANAELRAHFVKSSATLVIPGARETEHKVERGETLKTIAETYKVPISAIILRNELSTEISLDTLRQKQHKIGLFRDEFGARKLDEIVGQEVADWIDELGYDAPATFNNVLKHLRAMLSAAVEGKLIRENPLDAVKRRADGIERVEILSVEEVTKLFRTGLENRRFHPALFRLALEFFVGMRYGSACRIKERDIKFEDRGIDLPAWSLKTKRRFYIDKLPDNLWSWLDYVPPAWDLEPREYLGLKSALFGLAEVVNPGNGARHSFATYYLAATKNPGAAATILCHTDQRKLWSNYNGKASEAAGKRYLSITPQVCLGLEPKAALPRLAA